MTDILERETTPRSSEEPALEVELQVRGALCALELRGELTAATVGALHAQIDQLSCTPCTEVILDFSGLDALDEVGSNVLVGLYYYVAGRGGRTMINGASVQVAESLAGTVLVELT